ncbi:hypothetical protein BDD12DRAFT_886555 [Trichophaea hybrida]|nr:hypothetical protein BDD12DRAFT_886555 [Trichophaea hybrida]
MASPSPLENDEVRAFQKQLEGRWEEYYQKAGNRTHSGLGTTKHKAFLYIRQMIFREVADPQQARIGTRKVKKKADEYHIVRCCHCHHVWGPLPDHEKTTSGFGRHFRNHHKRLPADEEEEQILLQQIIRRGIPGSGEIIREPTQDNPWTKAARMKQGGRITGERFCERTYRELLAAFIVETNSAFQLVESSAFQKLV